MEGITNSQRKQFGVPKIQDTVCYIAGCIVFNQRGDEVLLVEEAKKSCRGKWYLPIGKVDPKEPIGEAAIRETLEEAGIYVELLTLICIEYVEGPSWLRFPFLGKWVSGQLKTKPDKESLSARFWPVDIFYNMKRKKSRKEAQKYGMELRYHDIAKIIVQAHKVHEHCYNPKSKIQPFPRFHAVLNKPVPHEQTSIDTVILSRNLVGALIILQKKKEASQMHQSFITTKMDVFNRADLLQTHMSSMANFIFPKGQNNALSHFQQFEKCGLLDMQHSGENGKDGIKLKLLYYYQFPFTLPEESAFLWEPLSDELDSILPFSVLEELVSGIKFLPHLFSLL